MAISPSGRSRRGVPKSLEASGRKRWRRLLFEGLEDRRLLAYSAGVPEIPVEYYRDAGFGAAAGLHPYAPVDRLVSEATRRAMDISLGPYQLGRVASGDMISVSAGPAPRELQIRTPHNVDAADTTNTDQIQVGGSLGLNLDGAGYTVGVWDGGAVRDTHQEFGGRVTVIDNVATHYHATHVAGTIGAAGVSSSAQGMATGVNVRSRDWTNDLIEIDADASLLDVSNHSYGNVSGWSVYSDQDWGVTTSSGWVDVWFEDRYVYSGEDTSFGKYSGAARDLDQVLYDNATLLSVWSSGNDRNDAYSNASSDSTYIAYFSSDPGLAGWGGAGWYLVPASGPTSPPGGDGNGGTGYDTLSSDQNAKNSLVVGAVGDVTVDPYSSVAIAATSFSSYGPTDDGRVKPDVVGNGAGLTSTMDSSDTAYASLSGTSMSSPNIAGTSVLLAEHFEDSFSSAPRSASTKGALIHTAADAGNIGPDYAYGWGLADAAAAASFISDAAAGATQRSHFLEKAYDGSEWTLDLESDGAEPLKATIVWTDPAGTAHGGGLDITTSVLVNDLDLWVTGPGGAISYPWTLDGSNPSDLAVRTQANHVDNVEQVLIEVPTTGTYTLHVGHSGISFTQDYSLLISGATLGPDTAAPTVVTRNPAAGATIKTSSSVDIDVTFSEAVQGVDATDLVLSGAAAASANVGVPSQLSSNAWRFPVSGLIDGALQLNLAPDSDDIEDLAGNDLAPATWDYTVELAWVNSSTIAFDDSGPATPYPSTIDVAGLAGSITDVNVVLKGVSHTWPDDLDLLLVGPAGQKVVLMSDIGGSGDITDVTLTLDDESGSSLPDSSLLSSGTFQPTNFEGTDSYPSPAPAGPYQGLLSAFDGTDPNGTWSLYGIDDTGGDSGSIADGWELTITTDAPGEIRGVKWDDQDGDGLKDAGEPLLSGWAIYLDDNKNGQFDTDESSTVTAGDGSYAFSELAPGEYTVAEVMQGDWEQIFPGADGVIHQAGLADNASYTERARQLSEQLTTESSSAPMFLSGAPLEPDRSTVPDTEQSGPLINLGAFQADPRFSNIDGQGYAVVVLDTGINLTHPYFGDRIVYSYDFADGDADASDFHGHGSNVTSIAASQDATHPGVAPGANIIHLKVFEDSGAGNFGYSEQALQWVVTNAATYNIAAVNMSLGDALNHSSAQSLYGLGDELAALATMDVFTVSASGNDFYGFSSVPGIAYPSADPYSLSVGAVYDSNIGGVGYVSGAIANTTDADRVTPFSQRHDTLTDSLAPGAPITGAAATGTGTVTMHGTSQASPHVAGAAVLAQQLAVEELGRRLTLSEFRTLLDSSGVTVKDGDDEDDNVTNTGLDFPRIDMLALGEAIVAMAAVPFTHRVTVQGGQVVEGIDFGNQQLPGVVVSESEGTTMIAEGGATDDYLLALTTTPTGAVEVTVSADGDSEISADGITYTSSLVLTFTDTTAQSVTVRAIDDGLVEGNHTSTITHAITGTISDPGYPATRTVDAITASVTDNDVLPQIATLTPSDDAAGVALTTNLIINFDREMTKGSGNITIYRSSDDSVAATIDVGSAAVVVDGTSATINPASDLLEQTGYYVRVPGTAFKDQFDNFFPGLSGPASWNFVTADVTPPSVTAIKIASQSWKAGFLAAVDPETSGGYAITDDEILPWTGLDTIVIEWSEPVSVASDDLLLDGFVGSGETTLAMDFAADFGVSNFSYDAQAMTATWELGKVFADSAGTANRVTIGFDGVTDAAGNPLEPLVANKFNVSPGDIDQSGFVDFTDLGILYPNKLFTSNGAQGYSVYVDIDGSNFVDFTDLGLFYPDRLFTELPDVVLSPATLAFEVEQERLLKEQEAGDDAVDALFADEQMLEQTLE